MRETTIRQVIHLRLSLVGTEPEVWRELVVDRELSLAALREAIVSVFGGPACPRHVFTDSPSGRALRRRTWGDRWTMIHFRDPTVVDAKTARVGRVLRSQEALYCSHSCEGNWVVRIHAGRDDVVAAADPAVRVAGGERRSPFACSAGSFEIEAVASVLDDPTHRDHDALRTNLDATVGPWSTHDPAEFDLDAARRGIESASGSGTAAALDGPLDSLVRVLPAPARPGMREHLAAAGLDLPVLVTDDDTRDMTRGFRWLISRVAAADVLVVDGKVLPPVIADGAAVLGWSEERTRRLFDAARRLRLVYTRSGRLLVKKSVLAAESSTALWSILSDEIRTARLGDDHVARDLFLLALADGSLVDPSIGVTRIAEVYAIARREPPYWTPDRWDHDDAGQCAQHCDCPRIDGATWHEIVARSIRDAAAEAAADGAQTIVSQIYADHAREAGVRPDWVQEPDDDWSWPSSRRRASGGTHGADLRDAPGELLRNVAELIEMLELFGLVRADDGAWLVPSALKEFARATLQSPRAPGAYGRGGFAYDF